MVSLGKLIPEWVGDMDEQINLMLEGFPEPRPHEFSLEKAPRLLLECMVLARLLNDVGHAKGLSKQERHSRALLLAFVVPLKAFVLDGISKQYPDIRKGITCPHLRNDGRLWSRPIKLP